MFLGSAVEFTTLKAHSRHLISKDLLCCFIEDEGKTSIMSSSTVSSFQGCKRLFSSLIVWPFSSFAGHR